MTETELRIGELGEVRVSLDPHLSVLALITDALGGRRRGAPEAWRRLVREAVSPAGAAAVRPICPPGYSVSPDSLTPLDPTRDLSVAEQVERLHDISADELLTDLDEVFDGAPPAHWLAVADRPRPWLDGYAGVNAEVWAALEPLWRQAQPLLNREVERVGAAAVRGRLDVILGDLSPRTRMVGDVLKISDPEPARFSLDGRALVLVPMLAGPDALVCSLDRPDAVWLAYPVRGARLLSGAQPAPPRDEPLDLLLGVVRAQVLTALGRPLTMGEVAATTGLAPSAVTYHCERLAAVGLVQRERRGREVRVSRTELAMRLLDLFR